MWTSCRVLWTDLTEVVIGTTQRVVKASALHCMLAGQRGDARYAKSIGGVPWQPNPAEVAEGVNTTPKMP